VQLLPLVGSALSGAVSDWLRPTQRRCRRVRSGFHC